MDNSRSHRIELFRCGHLHRVRYHGAQYGNIQGMFIKIVFFAAQILLETDLPVKVPIIFDDVCYNRLYFGIPRIPYNLIQFFLNGKDTHRLKSFKLDIVFGHRRNRLCRLQHENAEQAKILNTVHSLYCKL